MPEVAFRVREADTNETPLLFFTYGGHKTLDGFGSHFVENADQLAGQQRSVHYDERSVRAHELSKGFQINSLAFRHLAANFQWYLESDSDRTTTLRVSRPMH